MGGVSEIATRAESVGWPDHEAEGAAREKAGQLGSLDLLAEWIAGVQGHYPPRQLERARLVIFAADHGVAAANVSKQQLGYAARAAGEIRSGNTSVNDLAELSGAGIRIVELAASARIDNDDALTTDAVADAISTGIATADEEIDAGADLLIVGGVGAGSSTTAATLVSILAAVEPVKTVGRGGGIDDATWMRKATAVRDARRRGWPHRNDPIELLRVVGGSDVAAMTGFIFQAAIRRTPVLLDGVVAAAAAMVAAAAQPRVTRWCRAAQLTPEPAHEIALARGGLTALLDLGITAGDGTGGLLAVPLLRAAVRLHSSTDV
jgi:nicotinate-nucleotide--dimethylbenzimidazole phosphoribosyltransferase